MSKSLRFTAACLITALFSLQALAQTVTISGTVRNSTTKEGVPAVSVVIKGSSSGTYTDDKGLFSISTSAKLPLTLVFTSVGFESKELQVSSVSSTLEVDFVSVSTLGQEVVVAAARVPQRILDAPVTIERLSSLALRNAAAPNYYEALTNLKGVDMHTASLTFRTVTTRGFVKSGNNRFNQLIDGMDNQAPGLNFSVGNIVGLTELDVDNMELLSGASSALYGSGGMNGTLLINSKNPFKYQGLSFNVKQGIMHVDGKQRPASPYYDWSFRWAKVIKNKLAFKLAWQLIKAEDWQATDYDDVARTNIISKIKPGGNRTNDPNYDGVNVYGDETSAKLDFMNIATGAQAQYKAGIAAASGGAIPDIVSTLNTIIPNGATYSQINTILGAAFPAALLPTIGQLMPFYWGLRNNWYQNNQFVSRTGYKEVDLVDYGALNFKITGGVHYKITPGIEASWNTYWGTGTAVYTGLDRYSLRNFKVAQHKLEFRHKNWFVRGYTTQENAGEAYQATALGRLMQEAFSPSASTWYPTYVQNYYTKEWTDFASTNTTSSINAHQFARSIADANMPLPGTTAFETSKTKIRTTAIGRGGAKFLDRSDLWSAEGQLNFSDALGFSDKIEVIAGLQWKQWVLNSQGTIFSDSAGTINISETGTYVQLRKKMFDDFLTLTGGVRYDKQTNFDGRWTPRFTALMKVAKDNNVRLSFQTAYRFPSNQDQYINLNTGSVILIGALPEFVTKYGLNTGTYTAESVGAARASSDASLLKASTFGTVKPESVSSGEVGYKGLITKKLFIDAYGYYSRYKDFFASVAVVKAATPSDALNPFTSTNYSYIQNSSDIVKATGWGIGLDYQMNRGYIVGANLFSDKIKDLTPGLISYFNAPKYRANLSLRNDNVCKGIGFNIIAKWQDVNHYEGTFVAGTLPAFTWIDAQVSYRMPKSKNIFRIGGTNILNDYFRTGYGSPYVGGLYYVSYGYNIF